MIGTKVVRYRITRKIGHGGMGDVFLATHETAGGNAVVKVLKKAFTANLSIVQRFINEARVAMRIAHPGIVQVMDLGKLDSGELFILMEHLRGETLSARLKAGRLPVTRAVAFTQQAARALDAAHRHDVIHRDLKPDNMFLVPDPEVNGGERIKLLDFGIAKLAEHMGGGHTHSFVLMGTPAYMSPEQCRGASGVDLRTDLYAMGVILFEMLCGRRPFLERTFGDYTVAHLTKSPPRARDINPEVPKALSAVIERLLAKVPDDRYASARDLILALDDAMRSAGLPRAHTDPAEYKMAHVAEIPHPTREETTTIRLGSDVTPAMEPETPEVPPRIGFPGSLSSALRESEPVQPHSRTEPAPAQTLLPEPAVPAQARVAIAANPAWRVRRDANGGSKKMWVTIGAVSFGLFGVFVLRSGGDDGDIATSALLIDADTRSPSDAAPKRDVSSKRPLRDAPDTPLVLK